MLGSEKNREIVWTEKKNMNEKKFLILNFIKWVCWWVGWLATAVAV